MLGKRVCGPASCTLYRSTAVPKEMRNGIRELRNLRTKPNEQRKGYASALMNYVCYEADKNRMVLLLTVTDKALVAFYKRFGFQKLPSDDLSPILMARQAHG